MTAASLRIAGLGHRYGSHRALDGIELTALGGVVTVLGPNGAGKSTLLRCVATVHRPTSGSVYVDGLDVGLEPDRTEARRRIGYSPQQPGFAPRATVFDVVDYLAICKEHHDRRRRHREVLRVLAAVDLTDRKFDRVATLSGGMVRRLGLAQALLGCPRLLVLDEPAAGLDPDQRLGLRDLLSRLGTEATVVVATHLTDEAAVVSSQVIVVADGRTRFSGPPATLVARADGKVWESDAPPEHAVRTWRLPTGRHRSVGTPPPGAALVAPTMEDAYLLLVAEASDLDTRGADATGWVA